MGSYEAPSVRICFIVGLTIALTAVFTLRRFYSSALVIREDHRLITHGIDRFVRHPIYLGVLIAIMGAPFYATGLYGFLILLLLIPILLHPIGMEEALLAQKYGETFRSYREGTSQSILFIY
jgi:protein-S-isoprenylcysteine O-methyltransferase Ste14